MCIKCWHMTNEEELKFTARKKLYAICKGVMLLWAATPPSSCPHPKLKTVFIEDPSSGQPPPTQIHSYTEQHETRLRH